MCLPGAAVLPDRDEVDDTFYGSYDAVDRDRATARA
jgi:hypothetical protein